MNATRQTYRESAPVILPAHVAVSTDLTWQARNNRLASSSPFDGDSQAERLFDCVLRGFHRRTYPNVLLVGERGVGKSTYVAELATMCVQHRQFSSLEAVPCSGLPLYIPEKAYLEESLTTNRLGNAFVDQTLSDT